MSVINKILNGTFLQKITGRNLLFIGIVAVLFSIYIGFRYNCYSKVLQINKLDKELSELKGKSTEIKTKYQSTISMKEISEKLAPVNVGPSKEPVKKIIIIK